MAPGAEVFMKTRLHGFGSMALCAAILVVTHCKCRGGETPAVTPSPAPAAAAADAPAATTPSGADLPHGWALKISDRFGTDDKSTVRTMEQLHAKYYEAQFYNREANGLVKLPNVVINKEQQTYVHFEKAIVFAGDHLTIQGRGQPDGSITSGEMVSIHTSRSFCVEARYRIPSQDKSWPAFWLYAAASGNDSSELDFEQPLTPKLTVHDVTMFNHPGAKNVEIADPLFTTKEMTWRNPDFDASTAPHYYTVCYDDSTGTVTRYIDGKKIYSAAFKWAASKGGTGHGVDACTIINLAVGGAWPGNLANPSAYSGDLDLYSIEYYEPPTVAVAGPTPYPGPKDEAAWPGKGVIRVFPAWMVDNRKSFWSRREADQGSVVFVGDSNTGGWKAEQMAQQFPKLKVANRGIGGDVSRGVLFRFQEDVLDLHPKAVVLNIGSNDLTAYGEPADAIANITAIIEMAHKQDPALPVIVCTIAPSDKADAPVKPGKREELNDRIRKLGTTMEHVEVLDLFPLLAGPDGKPVPEYFAADKLHLAAPGYVKWGDALKPILGKLKIE